MNDVISFLKVSYDWVYRRFKAGNFPGRQLPGSRAIRFDPAEIKAYAKGDWQSAQDRVKE